jgi:hypothetical protein
VNLHPAAVYSGIASDSKVCTVVRSDDSRP